MSEASSQPQTSQADGDQMMVVGCLVALGVLLAMLLALPIPPVVARRVLHLGTSLLVLTVASFDGGIYFIQATALAILVLHHPYLHLTWLWDRFRPPSSTPSGSRPPGIVLYAVATVATYTCLPEHALHILGPMFFADPAAAIVGGLLKRSIFQPSKSDKEALKNAPRAPLAAHKTFEGSLAFTSVSSAWFVLFLNMPLLPAMALSSLLALVELMTGTVDNVMIAAVSASYFAGHLFPLGFGVAVAIPYYFLQDAKHLEAVGQAMEAYYQFTRPHTVIGTVLSITVVSTLAIAPTKTSLTEDWVSSAVFVAILSALNMNVFIVGLNQMYDIQIDLINKPYLPVASGEFPVPFGWALVLMHGIAGVLWSAAFGNVALFITVFGSGVIGTVYSVPYPIFRWKQYPTLAALCILVVRGLVVQIGFYDHMRLSAPEAIDVGYWYENTALFFSVVFFVVLGISIALFKDIPDIEGDKKAGIRTLAVRIGARGVVNLCAAIAAFAYIGATIFWFLQGNFYAAVAHLVLGFILVSKEYQTVVDGPEAAAEIRSSYMMIWKVFYAEYLALLLAISDQLFE